MNGLRLAGAAAVFFLLWPAAGAAPWPEKRYVTTESGLKYRDPLVGRGDAVRKGDVAVLRYAVRLDPDREPVGGNDKEAPAPLSFIVGDGKVVAGLEEGVVGLRAGGRRHLIVPGKLAAGRAGRPPQAPADAGLY